MYSDSLIRRVFKDVGMQFAYVNKEHLEYVLSICPKSKEKWELFTNTMANDFKGDESRFFKESERIIGKATTQLDAVLENFTNEMIDAKLPKPDFDIISGKIYHPDNVGRDFLALDIIKGNFTSIKFFTGAYEGMDYDDFMSQFTDSEYFKQSKQIRQIVFGKCKPKLQHKMMERMTHVLASGFQGQSYFSTGQDEIIVSLPFEMSNKLLDVITNTGLWELFSKEHFTLDRTKSCSGYIKVNTRDEKITHHCVNKNDYIRHIKEVNGITDKNPMDNWFIHEGRLATFVEY